MLNAEKYKDEIQKLLDRGYGVAMNKKTKKVATCKETRCNNCVFDSLKGCAYGMEKWLISECQESILNDAEYRYLKGVIKPFRDKVDSISKITERWNSEEICIYVNNDGKCRCDDVVYLPQFERGTMYKGMEPGKAYTIEELGL